jgi:predicted O-methyltransferase YrrM
MTRDEINKFAEDRPLKTVEIHEANDFYGHASIIKQYAGISPDYQVKAAIEHGFFGTRIGWDADLNSPLPAIFFRGPKRYAALSKYTNKALVPIGPYIAYAPHYMDQQTIAAEKKRLGKMLLAFPAHSTHWIDTDFDFKKYCQELANIGKDFDSICICLYWKDILRGQADIFLSYGFECFTAGHIFDPLFLPRLKSIIEICTVTTSNLVGTHLGYSIFMGKPCWLVTTGDIVCSKAKDVTHEASLYSDPDVIKLNKAFSVRNNDISTYQKKLVEQDWGISKVKSPEEMRFLLEMTDDIYKKGHNYFMSSNNLLLEQAVDYLNLNKNHESLAICDYLTVASGLVEVNYIKAVALARLNKLSEAIECLENLLTSQPAHLKAKTLHTELTSILTGQNKLKNNAIYDFGENYYGSVILNPSTLASIAGSIDLWREIVAFHHLLATDNYVEYLDSFYRVCLERFGSGWKYWDIINVLYASAKYLQPKNYLEIGVRRGRSASIVARGCPSVDMVVFDMWEPEYAGMANPGPEFVRNELKKHGHNGTISFIDGDSHQTVPAYFQQNPHMKFDLITVDGDHTENGALDDLRNVVPQLAVGGVLVFDDISHPAHPYMLKVWRHILAMFPFLASFEFTEMGYGVAFAIRRSD